MDKPPLNSFHSSEIPERGDDRLFLDKTRNEDRRLLEAERRIRELESRLREAHARIQDVEAKLRLAKQLLWREGDEGATGGEALAIHSATVSTDPQSTGAAKI